MLCHGEMPYPGVGGRGGAGLTLFPFVSVWMPPPRIVPALAGAFPQEVDCGLRTQGAENSPLRPSPVSGGLKGPGSSHLTVASRGGWRGRALRDFAFG